MELQENTSFGIELIKSFESFSKRIRQPQLICSVQVKNFPDYFYDGNITVLRKNSNKWGESQKSLTKNESQIIFEYLKKLGFPNQLPQIEMTIGTANYTDYYSFHFMFEEKHFYLNLASEGGNFSGADAQNFVEIFQYIFTLIGIKDFP